MALVRVTALKDFTGNPLSTTQVGPTSTGGPSAGQRLFAALHLTGVSTGRTLVSVVQSASSSGFGTPTNEITFALTSARGSTWQTLAAPSTDRPFRRASFTLSTAASTAGSWNGLVYIGFK